MCCYFAFCSCFGSVRWQVCVSNTGLLIGLTGFLLDAWLYKLEWIVLPFVVLLTYSTIRKIERKKRLYWWIIYVLGALTLILLGILSGLAIQDAVVKENYLELVVILIILITFVPFHLYSMVLVYADHQNWLSTGGNTKKIDSHTLSVVQVMFKEELKRQESKFDPRVA